MVQTLSPVTLHQMPDRPADLQPPPVTPRIHRAYSTAAIPLHTFIADLLTRNVTGTFVLTGPPGSGKSTAIAFLHHHFPAPIAAGQLLLSDHHPPPGGFPNRPSLILLTHQVPNATETLTLAPWTLDDCIEYLASRHRDQIPSILPRLQSDPTLDLLLGNPEMLSSALTLLATIPTEPHTLLPLGELFWDLVPIPLRTDLITSYQTLSPTRNPKPFALFLTKLPPTVAGLWRHDAMQHYFFVRWVVDSVEQSNDPALLPSLGQWHVLPIVIRIAARQPRFLHTIQRALDTDPGAPFAPIAACILAANDHTWRPSVSESINLAGASFRGVNWPGINLSHANLRGTNFSNANLTSARFTSAFAEGANFSNAILRHSLFENTRLTSATLSGADLTEASCPEADFLSANLTGTKLLATALTAAHLDHATLESADFTSAILRDATLKSATFESATFLFADLAHTLFVSAKMYLADWTSASFHCATLQSCDLEGLTLPDANFTSANLTGSLLTNSQIPRGNFSHANLSNTGLADIHWPVANLTSANLSRASFHLGSSRSGLVGSLTPSEGSRTGFYTDDAADHHYRPPEEIRKANLTQAILQGANLYHTDFYLVDLRHALYNATQHQHLKATGAILTITRR